MARKPAPTKTNLFKAKHELRFSTEGCELLHQKRDVLVMELMSVSAMFSEREEQLRKSITTAMDDFAPAYLLSGQETMERLFSGMRGDISLTVKERSVMGTFVPEVDIEDAPGGLAFSGLLDSSPAMDAAITGVGDVLESLVKYVETVATIWRLATEVEKTQRRINAIENIFIPESRETVEWIESVMEENDREELFRRKLLKNRSMQTGE